MMWNQGICSADRMLRMEIGTIACNDLDGGLFHDPSLFLEKMIRSSTANVKSSYDLEGHLVLAGLSGAYVLMNSFVMEDFPWKSVTCT